MNRRILLGLMLSLFACQERKAAPPASSPASASLPHQAPREVPASAPSAPASASHYGPFLAAREEDASTFFLARGAFQLQHELPGTEGALLLGLAFRDASDTSEFYPGALLRRDGAWRLVTFSDDWFHHSWSAAAQVGGRVVAVLVYSNEGVDAGFHTLLTEDGGQRWYQLDHVEPAPGPNHLAISLDPSGTGTIDLALPDAQGTSFPDGGYHYQLQNFRFVSGPHYTPDLPTTPPQRAETLRGLEQLRRWEAPPTR